MPRPRAPFLLRPSRRTILLACILLLVGGGAIVNVAVAWVLGGAPDSWTRGGPVAVFETNLYTGPPLTEAQQRRVKRKLWAPSSWSAVRRGGEHRGLGWTLTLGFAVEQPRWEGMRIDGGWPARSMALVLIHEDPPGELRYSLSLESPQRLLPSSAWFEFPRDRIPLTPVFPGFAINTLFYAAILALPLSVFPIRRRLRARRGRCPACGYDLTGASAPGGGGVCPECGAERPNVAPLPA